MVQATTIGCAYGSRPEGGSTLGLSKVHISSRGARGISVKEVVVGEARVERIAPRVAVPVNGWGKSEEDAERPGDELATIRRTMGMVSIGRVPVIRGAGRRDVVRRFSAGSKSRLTRYLSSALADYRYMATLTMPGEWSRDGEVFKQQVDRYLVWFMRQMRQQTEVGVDHDSICWFLEFQQRGAPHIHFLYTSRVHWELAAKRWADGIGDPDAWRTSTRFETIRHGRAGITSYARKYAGKSAQKVVPDDYQHPGRFWGVRGYRVCGTCHTTGTGKEGGAALLKDAYALLDRAVDDGLLRRVRWTRGDGYCYWPSTRAADLYTIGIGQQLDLILMRYAESWT